MKIQKWRLFHNETERFSTKFSPVQILLYIKKESKIIPNNRPKNLIKERVQAINDEFLEWFVNPSCEEVE
jgi:DNA recombination-dependent growth factor C